MKRFIMFLIAGLLIGSARFGQIVITADDFPTTGSYTRGSVVDSVSFNVGSAGPNQTWTFGDYAWQMVMRTDHLLSSNTPYGDSFPTATQADRHWTHPDDPEDAFYDYQGVTPDTVFFLGQVSAREDTVIFYDPPMYLAFPLGYGSSGALVRRTHTGRT